jgi:hypothetical protein
MRYYANANRYPWAPAHDRTPVVQAPVGLTFVTHEKPARDLYGNERVRAFKTGPRADWFNRVNVNAHDHGGHFIPRENPDAWVSDLRRKFHRRRSLNDPAGSSGGPTPHKQRHTARLPRVLDLSARKLRHQGGRCHASYRRPRP